MSNATETMAEIIEQVHEMPEAFQDRVRKCIEKITAVIKDGEEAGVIALAWVGATIQMAAEQDTTTSSTKGS